ncbi:MAG: VCBS repeat-containing protein [Chloroflexi bacterium]|nr:VCBS repeat-containing protein [Chloroflexota bacterium]
MILEFINRSKPRRQDHQSGRRAAAVATILATLALLAAACGDGGEVRVIALTPTPAPDETPTRSDTGPSIIVTATPTPTAIEGTATPTPTQTATRDEPSEPPPRPEEPLASALLLRDYLLTGEANLPGCLPDLVSAWGLAPTSGERCLFADFDGDGASEFVFALTLADGGGDIWFYESSEEDFRLFSSARVLVNATLEGVTIEAIADLTGDRFPDLVISTLRCEDDACDRRLLIISNHRGNLEDLMPAGVPVSATAGVRVETPEEAGGTTGGARATRLLIEDETVSDSSAGPVRASNLALTWTEAGFISEATTDAPRYLFHAIVDADGAFRSGDYARARALYASAAADTSLVDWRVEQGRASGRAELSAYALFRAALAAQRLRDDAGMVALLDQAVDDLGRTLHGQVAAIYREGLRTDTAPGLICSAIEQFLRAQESRFDAIWNYGPHNPEHRISELCS